jgi:hypothetical protein
MVYRFDLLYFFLLDLVAAPGNFCFAFDLFSECLLDFSRPLEELENAFGGSWVGADLAYTVIFGGYCFHFAFVSQ